MGFRVLRTQDIRSRMPSLIASSLVCFPTRASSGSLLSPLPPQHHLSSAHTHHTNRRLSHILSVYGEAAARAAACGGEQEGERLTQLMHRKRAGKRTWSTRTRARTHMVALDSFTRKTRRHAEMGRDRRRWCVVLSRRCGQRRSSKAQVRVRCLPIPIGAECLPAAGGDLRRWPLPLLSLMASAVSFFLKT